MHPAIGLLIYVVIAIHLALPIGTWLLMAGQRDDKSRLWFTSIAVYSFSICSITLRPMVPEYVSYLLAWAGSCVAWLLMVETFRRELNFSPRHWPQALAPGLVWWAYLSWVYENGWMTTVGVLSYSAVFVLLNMYLSYLLWQMQRMHRSKSLLLIQLAFALLAASYLNRIYQYAVSPQPEYLNVFSFSWVSNLVTLSALMGMVLICFGYWGFVLEKSTSEKKAAQAGQRQAESESEAMRQLVKERDQLLMLNARVSSLSSLSSFSAMLIHDISQPLQALELGLYGLQSEVQQKSPAQNIQAHIDQLMLMSGKASEMVSSLRRLMIRGQDQMESVEPGGVIAAIYPILKGAAHQRHIELALNNRLPANTRVQANAVMLQRIVFNLLANALDAFKASPMASPRIQIGLSHCRKDEADWVVLHIEDNGPGLPDVLLKQLTGPVVSDKAEGSGLNLLLTQNMLRLWGGHTAMRNRTASEGSGAVIELWLSTTPFSQ